MNEPPPGAGRRAGNVVEHFANCSASHNTLWQVSQTSTCPHEVTGAYVLPNWALLGAVVDALIAGLAGSTS